MRTTSPQPARVFQSLLTLLAFTVMTTLLPDAHAQEERIALTQEMLDATDNFLGSLSADQRAQATFEFGDEERLNWHFIPRPREGITYKEMSASQREASTKLLQTFLSAKGFDKAEQIRDLERVLKEIEGNGRFLRDPEIYYFTVFGEPSLNGNWGFRYEGHHLAFNWTFAGGLGIASSPQFFGTNPAEVSAESLGGSKTGLRVLGREEDIARGLLQSMNASQRSQALIEMDAPRDIFTGADKQVTALDDIGIAFSDLDSQQKQQLLSLIEEVAHAQPDHIANERMENIRADSIDEVKFAWLGMTERGEPHYFRVQGSGFLIEYDNTQNDANHVHLVWRDFDGDFGRDLIRMHYEAVAGSGVEGHRH